MSSDLGMSFGMIPFLESNRITAFGNSRDKKSAGDIRGDKPTVVKPFRKVCHSALSRHSTIGCPE